MFRSLYDHHQDYLRIKLIGAGYMLGSQLCLQNKHNLMIF